MQRPIRRRRSLQQPGEVIPVTGAKIAELQMHAAPFTQAHYSGGEVSRGTRDAHQYHIPGAQADPRTGHRGTAAAEVAGHAFYLQPRWGLQNHLAYHSPAMVRARLAAGYLPAVGNQQVRAAAAERSGGQAIASRRCGKPEPHRFAGAYRQPASIPQQYSFWRHRFDHRSAPFAPCIH